MLLPIARDDAEIRRHAWICYVIFAVNILTFIGVGVAERDAARKAEQRWQEAIDYHAERPYLKTPASMARVLDPRGVTYLEERRRNYGNAPLDRIHAEQRELDSLAAAAEEALRVQPSYALGYVPAHSNPLTIFTSMFVHAGLLHLIGNLLYLFLSGPFIEDVFGRPLFVLLYFGGGTAATLLFGARNSDSTIPLVGASGAIAAVMGAYLVRFARSKIQFLFIPILFRPTWNVRFWLPAFVVLPLWFVQNLWGMRSEELSDIAFSAHVGGFAFGLAFALLVKITGIEEKLVNPAIVKETTWEIDERVVRALEARRYGNVELAQRELASVLRDGNASVDALQLAMDVARDAEDAATFDAASARLLARHVEQKETVLADELIREVTDDRFARLPKFLGRAAAFVERSGDREWALTLYERLYDADPASAGAVNALMKIGALRRLNGDFSGARAALTQARLHPACTPEWIPSIDAKLAQLG